MANIIDYIKWRGDITLKERDFNEVDGLIFTRLAYFPFEDLLSGDEVITIETLSQRAMAFTDDDFLILGDRELLSLMGDSPRYKDLKLINFVSEFSKEVEVQFAAITILLPKRIKYVCYRGTDNTLIGWKEDFNMTFMEHIPAQVAALNYLNDTKLGWFSKVLIGGHSKGGNLAMYAGVHTTDKIKKKIISITSIDGPGFLKSTIESEKFKTIDPKIKAYVPQTSIIGRFLNSGEKFFTVSSTEKNLLQHDIFSWEVLKDQFVYLENVDKDSEQMEKIIKDWLEKLSFDDRQKMISLIFEMLDAANVNTFKEFKLDWYKSMSAVYDQYRKLSNEDKKMLDEIANQFIKSYTDEVFKFPNPWEKND